MTLKPAFSWFFDISSNLVTTPQVGRFLVFNDSMQDSQKLTITVEQARKLSMGSLDTKSDKEVEQLIVQLDFLAELFIKGVVASKEATYKKKG